MEISYIANTSFSFPVLRSKMATSCHCSLSTAVQIDFVSRSVERNYRLAAQQHAKSTSPTNLLCKTTKELRNNVMLILIITVCNVFRSAGVVQHERGIIFDIFWQLMKWQFPHAFQNTGLPCLVNFISTAILCF